MSFQNPIPLRLKEARKKAKLSQKALGVRIGMDESSASPRMNQYEKGKHTPDVHTLKLIADELGVPLNYFFCEDTDSAELAVLINKLQPQEKKDLLELLKTKQQQT
ncbi:TPA: helix-turn-helix transcriptional regulator [Vibrio parahaemolyticus]|uniref:helix-turn-helix domain-containing protein n=1 Tax=Vibrio parahaemolyticus TaxID=670 RepID=UPI0011244462|nr:helix-turn-helix transcriptional regulator [Vibrio parahaemolyticus]MBE4297842.1 helix-turn-helix transcriptional regulator [Vibrio parahaemolyticus]MBE4303510.1 helix-turn-helix transcriptional regulator [Vibrio parahaemolyticus]MDF4727825.1 helix-turn-helix transcriptional regulator [Vibrio parahaemolyticus]MDF4954569.1 helix-turn-helix transcriptional regulator [Vibrio parahaemolyticus]MDF4997318.1 helix-turn-helix transcriptional regulator [Vibrio parahaemolyticus]